mmetsp:Transcript_20154/g.33962  ORF Transcript_20154/g.33962 Transcript_20154/m.33962 type:complete len:1454 (+) Transcript_20154:116-4477(+)
MDQLTADAKPFVPGGTVDVKTNTSDISASAPPFVPNARAPSFVPSPHPDPKGSKVHKKVKPKAEASSSATGKTIPGTGAPSLKSSKKQQEQKKKSTGDGKRRDNVRRDDEVRALTTQLREKEERLQQMEALQAQESLAQSEALAKRVEQEVTQKLFKASVLSSMYKDSLVAPEPTPSTGKANKRASPPKSSKQLKLIPSGRRAGGEDSRNTHNLDDQGGSGVGVSVGAGLLRFPASSRNPIENDPSQPGATPARVQKKSPQKTAVGKGKEKVQRAKVYEMTADELREKELSIAAKEKVAAERRFAAMELEIKEILNDIRQSKPLLQDFCLLGIAIGAPVDYIEKCSALREHYTTMLLEEAHRNAEPASRSAERWARKLCDLPIKQVGLIRQVLDKAEKKGGIDDTSVSQIRQVYLNELRNAVDQLIPIVDSLQKILLEEYALVNCGQNMSFESYSSLVTSMQEKHVRSSLQLIFIEIAEFGRQQLKYFRLKENKATPAEHELRAQMEAQVNAYRQRALSIAPHNGAPYEALSKLATTVVVDKDGKSHRKRDSFLGAYYLVRGMGIEIPYLAAREALLDIFEDQKSVSDKLENVTALSRLTLEEHIRRFKVHFLAAVGVAYSRTGADRLEYHLTKARRHVGTMLQMVSTAQLCDRNRGDKGSFSSYDQKAFQKESSVEAGLLLDLTQLAQCREVDQSLCQSLVITLSLIEATGSSKGIESINQESKWAAAYSNWVDHKADDEDWTLEDHIAHIEWEERCTIEKRYVAQRLHKLQVIPGLLDLLRLLVGLLSSLLGTESIGNVLDTERKTGKPNLKKSTGKGQQTVSARSLSTTRMLATFFEWLDTHPDYHAVITTLDVVGWESVEAELPHLVSGLCTLANPIGGDSPSRVTKDDFDLVGFIPLQPSVVKNTAALVKVEHDALTSIICPVDDIAGNEGTVDTPLVRSFDALHQLIVAKLITFEQQTVAWVSQYAARCCRCIRDLCEQEVRFGELNFFVDPDTGKRAALLPSLDASDVSPLTVVVYNTAAPSTRISGFNNILGKSQIGTRQSNFVLSKEAFMRGAVVPVAVGCDDEQYNIDNDEEVEDDIDKDDVQNEDDSAGLEEDKEGNDLSSLSDDGVRGDGVGSGGDLYEDDDDLDLTNLVLEDVEEEVRHTAPPPPPPGFMPLHEQLPVVTEQNIDTSSDYVDDDFAAMCAALLNVPQTEDPSSLPLNKVEQQEDAVGITKEKGGLLHVKVPPKVDEPSSPKVNKEFTRAETKRTSQAKPRVYSSTNQKQHLTSTIYRSMKLNKSGDIPLIVVDAPNVAMRHGLNAKFSCRGIQLALNFFRSAGHDVIAFLPDYYLNFERVGELRRLARLNIGDVRAAQLPDDIEVLQQLVQQGFVIGTPSQDYDDSYCITYAQKRGGYIISNDMYRDHVKRIESKELREEARKWVKSHVISYTFVGDEFLPNPDASIFAR